MVELPTQRLYLLPNTEVLVEGKGIEQMDYIDVSELDGPCPDYGPDATWGTPRSDGGTVQKPVENVEAYCATRAIDGKTVIIKKQDIERTEELR